MSVSVSSQDFIHASEAPMTVAENRAPTAPVETPQAAPTVTPQKPKRTDLSASERETKMIKERIDEHVEEWWPDIIAPEILNRRDLRFIISDGDHALWFCTFSYNNEGASRELYFLWNGHEITSYENEQEAFCDFIRSLKDQRLEGRFKYWTSSLTVSAFLASALLVLISGLFIFGQYVPDQLWSIFTAVIAFYFGRGLSSEDRRSS